MKKLTHYKDTLTGRYVEKATWRRSRAHGGTRYKRTYERYVKPTGPRKRREITPAPKPPETTPDLERLTYQSGHKTLQIEIRYKNGKITSVQIGRRTYHQRASIILLRPLVEAARLGQRHPARRTRRK